MFLSSQVLILWLFLLCITSSSVLLNPALNSTDSSLDLPLPGSNVTVPEEPSSHDLSWPPTLSPSVLANLSILNLNTSLSAKPALNLTGVQSVNSALAKCNGDKYGYGLSKDSCQEAWDLLPKSQSWRTCKYRTYALYIQEIHIGMFQHVYEGAMFPVVLCAEVSVEGWNVFADKVSVGKREAGEFDVPLPFRLLSCRCRASSKS